jgi:photosystem I subunit XI
MHLRNMTTFVERIEQSNDNPRDPRNQEVIHPAGDPQYANLATPINSSGLIRDYLNSLPAYRLGLSPVRRGLEVGIAHGYWLVGPFAKFNPLRLTDGGTLIALFSTIGLIVISTLLIWLYAASNPPKPLGTLVVPNPPDAFKNSVSWNQYGSGFLVGGSIGAVIAFAILANVDVLDNFLHLVGYR